MSRHRLRSLALALAVLVAACGGGGGDDYIAPVSPKKPAAAAPGAPPPRAGAQPSAVPSGLPPLPIKELTEADFAETDRSRDPFRSFEQLFMNQAKVQKTLQRHVLIDHYALDELKLVGVVTRGAARALLVDPTGLGWVGKVGDFVGRAELVHSGGPTGTDVAINWRIDRIRESDVVLVREDPSHPEIPPTTRVLALYPDADANGNTQTR